MQRTVAFAERRLERLHAGAKLVDARLLLPLSSRALRHHVLELGDPGREPVAIRFQIGRRRSGLVKLRVDATSPLLRRSEPGLDLDEPHLRGGQPYCDVVALAPVQLGGRARLVRFLLQRRQLRRELDPSGDGIVAFGRAQRDFGACRPRRFASVLEVVERDRERVVRVFELGVPALRPGVGELDITLLRVRLFGDRFFASGYTRCGRCRTAGRRGRNRAQRFGASRRVDRGRDVRPRRIGTLDDVEEFLRGLQRIDARFDSQLVEQHADAPDGLAGLRFFGLRFFGRRGAGRRRTVHRLEGGEALEPE